MTHGSLFSGIGGFDLAAEWMGWENKFHCEWNDFGQKVLKHYWPNAESFHDITKTDFTKYANRIDILTGGFPCQPYSMAGKRKGKEDERHLWPEMLRCIREVKPRWVVGENVLGLVNWSGGLVFHEVQADLESQGYEVFPYVLPAASVNAPHRRDRVWFVAYSKTLGCWLQQATNEWTKHKQKGNKIRTIFKSNGIQRDVTNTECIRLEHGTDTGEISAKERNAKGQRNKSSLPTETNGNGYKSNWKNFPTVSPICDGDDGLSDRLDSITFSKWRKESIKAGGNAIVPQVALQIFKTIQQYESRTN
jgi:DNA (cytosine-5)-methyltransferase 1